jgi:enoyl-CoA hydratase
VTEVVPHEDLFPAARRVAVAIAGNNRPAIAALHASYRRIEAAAAGDGIALESEAGADWMKQGGSEGIADRVPSVLDRGRSQMGDRGRGERVGASPSRRTRYESGQLRSDQ